MPCNAMKSNAKRNRRHPRHRANSSRGGAIELRHYNIVETLSRPITASALTVVTISTVREMPREIVARLPC